jgi:two-component response regulator (ARR-B family)
MFGRWLNGVRKDDKQKIRIGVSAICWAVWRTRNDIIFNKQNGTNFLQVIRRATHSIQQWVFLLPVEHQEDMVIGCNRMLVVAHDFFFQATGWRHLNRIANV